MKLNGVMLGSENPKALGEFYNKVFGKAGWQEGEWYGYKVGDGQFMVGPHSDIKGASKEPARIMINLECGDVKAEFEALKGKGAKAVAEPYQPNAKDNPKTWLATMADPDGNFLQLSSPWE